MEKGICPNCGKEVATVGYCPNCGASVPDVDAISQTEHSIENVQRHVTASPPVRFVSLLARSRRVTVLFAVIILVSLVAVVSDYIEINLLSRIQAGEAFTLEEAEASDNRQATIGIIQMAMFAVTVVVFLMWIHRAYKNLPALRGRLPKYSPGWAVGSWFVPFLNLVRPYQIVREIWENAVGPEAGLVRWWWGLFLLSGFVGSVVAQSGGETISEVLTASWLMLGSDALDIPAAVLAIFIVRRISTGQQVQYNIGLTGSAELDPHILR